MNIRKIIQEEVNDFGWMEDVDNLSFDYLVGKALYFDLPITDQDTLDKVLDKLGKIGFRHGDWSNELEFESEELVGLYMGKDGSIIWTGYIDEDYEEHISDYVGQPVVVLDGWELLTDSLNEDFDWVGDVPEYHSVLNKAFYFNPIAERGDGAYRKLVRYFKSLGFKPAYSTPDHTDGDSAVGLYTYRNMDGELSYVYTHDDDEWDYEMHIKGYSDEESDHGSEGLEILDARDFARSL